MSSFLAKTTKHANKTTKQKEWGKRNSSHKKTITETDSQWVLMLDFAKKKPKKQKRFKVAVLKVFKYITEIKI